MDKILLTGKTGFIGRNIQEMNNGKDEWFAPNSRELDVSNEAQLGHYILKHKISKIVHTAVFNHHNFAPQEELYRNVQMTMNMHKVASAVDRVIILGSGAEYAKEYDIVKVKEEEIGKHIPTSVYGLSKYLQQMIIGQSANLYNLRLFGVYGPYEDWKKRFISNLCCKAMFDLELTIRQNARFSYLSVADLVTSIDIVLHSPKIQYHDYNVVPIDSISLLEIANMVNDIAEKKLPIRLFEPGFQKEYTGSGERFQTEFSPCFQDYKTGIAQLYQWYLDHKNQIDLAVLKETR